MSNGHDRHQFFGFNVFGAMRHERSARRSPAATILPRLQLVRLPAPSLAGFRRQPDHALHAAESGRRPDNSMILADRFSCCARKAEDALREQLPAYHEYAARTGGFLPNAKSARRRPQ
jgi:hypothetical protein